MTPEQQRSDDHHLLRDPDDEDDWEWRRRIRASPRWRPLYQGAVFVLGLVLVLGGLALVPLPGPGWLIVIAGIAVWASEFEPATRLLDFVKDHVRAWEQWVRRQAWWVKVLVGAGDRLLRGVRAVADHVAHRGPRAAAGLVGGVAARERRAVSGPDFRRVGRSVYPRQAVRHPDV